MRRLAPIATALTLTTALTITGATQSSADGNAAVCAQTYGKSDGLACNFVNYEQCRASVSGISGSCIDNPYFRGTNQVQPSRKRVRP